MKFSSERQPAPERRSGGKSPMYTKIVRAIEKRFVGGVDGADTFEEWLVYKAISDGGVYLQEMLRRISPMHKPTLEPIEIDFLPMALRYKRPMRCLMLWLRVK